ncbi:N-acetylmuramoyl-L-alanine amidase [Constrictibacter sp. MBR-5]|jgi:spore germination cell wall hydrolase CwlJ-like protein|uniref:cell wall hydrolase n=1 Tax=Constrictibacter sp. MBR-5 TaxID=3156467 RepID=UPI0033946F36
MRPRLIPIREQNTNDPVDLLARTIWGEARGEPVRGMEAVAAVVMNRVARPGWWGRTVASVCTKAYQFSCWNEDDPNRAKLLAVTDADPIFAIARRIARRAVAGTLDDPTGGATHYHSVDVHPRWATGKTPHARIGRHLFYADID